MRASFVRPVWTFGALAVAVGQAAWMLAHDQVSAPEDTAVYRGIAPEEKAACRTTLRVVFKLDTPYAELVLALRRASVTLISGPSQTGEIWVLPPADQNPAETAAMLRQHHLVEYVDVIPPNSRSCAK
jgi:hypothetical protein